MPIILNRLCHSRVTEECFAGAGDAAGEVVFHIVVAGSDMFQINTNPSDRQLRQFGVICIFAFPLLASLWIVGTTAVVGGLVLGSIFALLGLVAPKLLKPVFLTVTMITFPIGIVVGELILLTIWFGLFLPMALVFRIIGRDVLQRRSTATAETFWVTRTPPRSVRKYYQQS
jgi:hypothetical protein